MGVNNAYARHLYEFVLKVAVECPGCKKEALVQTDQFPPSINSGKEPRLSCTHCGYNRLFTGKKDDNTIGHYIIGEPVDPIFHLPVWLQIRCGEDLLWAYNQEHLSLLKDHVSQLIRERNGLTNRNNSIGSRLPRWMTAARKRELVLQSIERLQEGHRDTLG